MDSFPIEFNAANIEKIYMDMASEERQQTIRFEIREKIVATVKLALLRHEDRARISVHHESVTIESKMQIMTEIFDRFPDGLFYTFWMRDERFGKQIKEAKELMNGFNVDAGDEFIIRFTFTSSPSQFPQ